MECGGSTPPFRNSTPPRTIEAEGQTHTADLGAYWTFFRTEEYLPHHMPSASPWHHAPTHKLDPLGDTSVVTSATYRRAHLFQTRRTLDFLQASLFTIAAENGAQLQAWAIFSNHYHFVAQIADPRALVPLTRKLHTLTAKYLNEVDRSPARKVWYQYWETRLTYERAYYARLHYVHRNPEHHKLVGSATQYPWCSAAWFEAKAQASFRRTVLAMPCERIKIEDDFEVVAAVDHDEAGR
jgi:putative transposase